MNKQNFIYIIFTLIGIFFISCDAWVTFSGKAMNKYGKPLKDVKIQILFNGKENSERSHTVSSDDGMYSIFENSCPCEFDFEIIASKEGYKKYDKKMKANEANTLRTLDIIMEEEEVLTLK